MISHVEMITRIAVGALCGGIIGYERDLHGRPVGLRTHLIVAMTAATFMVVSTQAIYYQHYQPGDLVEMDGSRIAASVVSGIGFLAAGAILRTGLTIQGLTTAAGLWLVTAIGMCAGAGMFIEGMFVTTMGIIALTVLRRFEDKNIRRRRISVVMDGDVAMLEQVGKTLLALGATATDLDYRRELGGETTRVSATFDVVFQDSVPLPDLIRAVEGLPHVREVHVQQGT